MILTHGSDPNQVALTFDDGPNLYYTWQLLDLLEKYHAKATFFVLGKHMKEQPGPTREAFERGHEIGNHGFSHNPFGQMTYLQAEDDVVKCNIALPHSAKWLRPPFGANPDIADKIASQWEMNVCMWSQLSGDWVAKSPEEIVSKVNLDTDKGEIVLLHDGGPDELGADRSNTVKAVEMILQKWPNKQYVTVSELTL